MGRRADNGKWFKINASALGSSTKPYLDSWPAAVIPRSGAQVNVLTQFNSESLHRHITASYKFDTFTKSFVEILAAHQTPEGARSVPGDGGCGVYQTAKQIDPDLNVIVITVYPDSEILDRILQVSPVSVLKKPLNG